MLHVLSDAIAARLFAIAIVGFDFLVVLV